MEGLGVFEASLGTDWDYASARDATRCKVGFSGDALMVSGPAYLASGAIPWDDKENPFPRWSCAWLYGCCDDGCHLAISDVSSTQTFNLATGRALLVSPERFDPTLPITHVGVRLAGLGQWLGDAKAGGLRLYEGPDEEVLVAVAVGDDGGASLSVDAERGICTGEALDIAGKLSSFLTFCCCFDAEVTSVVVRFSDGCRVRCYAPFVTGMGPEPRQLERMPLTLERLGVASVAAGIGSWLEAEGDLVLSRSLLASLLGRRWRLPLDVEFLTVAQVLEVLSKDYAGRNPPSESSSRSYRVFSRKRAKVLDALAGDDELQRWVRHHLQDGLSQRERIEYLFRGYDSVTEWVGLGDVTKCVKRHVDSRNFYTHRKDPADDVLYGTQLRCHTEGMMMVCQCVMAELSGMDLDAVLAAFTSSGYGRDERAGFRELYRAVGAKPVA